MEGSDRRAYQQIAGSLREARREGRASFVSRGRLPCHPADSPRPSRLLRLEPQVLLLSHPEMDGPVLQVAGTERPLLGNGLAVDIEPALPGEPARFGAGGCELQVRKDVHR